MKIIETAKGDKIQVDDADYRWLNSFTWWIRAGYAATRDKSSGSEAYMHRMILAAKSGESVDHKDRDRLNNRRGNLRLASQTENVRNSGKHRDGGSRFKGVSKFKGHSHRKNPWGAKIYHNQRQINLGVFPTEELAAAARDAAVKKLHGEFGVLNFSGGIS